jgi:hypothetical protein
MHPVNINVKIRNILLEFTILPLCALFFLILTSKVHAETYCDAPTDLGNCYVDGDAGLDTNDGKTPETAWATITKAATLVDDGDTVNVKGGITYNEGDIEPTNAGSADNYITYEAWPGYGIPVIDASESLYGFNLVYNSITPDANYIIISGFEIKNFSCIGIVINESSPTDFFFIIKNNIIHDSKELGIGLWARYYANVSDNSIKIYNNIFYNNDYGVWLESAYTPIGTKLVFFQNNILVNNSIGIYSDHSSIPLDIDYNNVWNNTTDYSGCSAGTHDISADPLFIDTLNNNFHLLASSPSINAGTTLSDVPLDILGVNRPQGGAYDMGVYEYYDIFVILTPLTPDPTSDNTPTFTGTATSAHISIITSISYSIDGGAWTTVGVSGTSTFSITLPELPDGGHSILVKATDSYGNVTDVSLYGSDTFVIDTALQNDVDEVPATGADISLILPIILLSFLLASSKLKEALKVN